MIEKITSSVGLLEKFNITNNKIIIGESSIVTFKYGLTLASPENYKTNIGDIICIKKSKHTGIINKKKEILELNQIYESVIKDYFADCFSDFIFSPIINDMKIIY
jgi:hypothetical protein